MATTTVKPDGTVTVETGEHAAKQTWDGGSVETHVIKSEDERRYTLTVAYPADKADVAVAADGHLDFASKSAVEDAAWGYMLKYRDIGAHHKDGTSGSGQLVESYIYRGPDWTVKAANGDEVVIKSGDWLMGTVWPADQWEKWKTGEFGGMSPQGSARRRTPSAEAKAALRS
jgi:putative serine protease XkdF